MGVREKILLAETGMVLATHGGPGTLGIAVVSKRCSDPCPELRRRAVEG